MEGSTLKEGKYSDQVTKAVNWFLAPARQQPNGMIGDVRNPTESTRYIYGQGFGVMFLMAFSLTSLGLVIAWRMDSTQGFHAIMNLMLLPIWLLSGAFFPASGVSPWLAWVMQVNPLTYGMAALRHCL